MKTHQTILFVANVGEEGLGDLTACVIFQARTDVCGNISQMEILRITTGGTGVNARLHLWPGRTAMENSSRSSAIHAAGRSLTNSPIWKCRDRKLPSMLAESAEDFGERNR